MLRKLGLTLVAVCLSVVAAVCANTPVQNNNALDQLIDKITAREAANVKDMEMYFPMAETYVQTYTTDKDLGWVPNDDQYFLGRVSFGGRVTTDTYIEASRTGKKHYYQKLLQRVRDFRPVSHTWQPDGFPQMAMIDASGFDRQHYMFRFVRREFLGTIRCLVFNVEPKPKAGDGRFMGRIFVEDHDFNIVRFNGIYLHPKYHSVYSHFDAWRVNVEGDQWLPAYIYSEESALHLAGKTLSFRSQTRFWDYQQSLRKSGSGSSTSEFTAVMVDQTVTDQSGETGARSPLASERAFQREAEDNVTDKLEEAGLLAPPSEVDKILETVTNNLIVTNNLTIDPEIRCRVLLTDPIESFTVGHTIIISRGLLDVLPDEASLAAALAHELAHIVLGHGVDTKFAFGDTLVFNEDQTIRRLAMAHTPEEEAASDTKAMDYLKDSPYKDKLISVGLFLKELQADHEALPNLTRSRIGNGMFMDGKAPLFNHLVTSAPELKKADVRQIAALPVGARIEVDPWSNHVTLTKAPTIAAVSAREKLPLTLTPFYPYLTRISDTQAKPGDAQKADSPQTHADAQTSSGGLD